MTPLSQYKAMLTQMPVNKTGRRAAPHKAVLLLAVIDLIERDIICSPFVPLSEELIHAFNDVWKRHVPQSTPWTRKFSYPFFHMQSSPFWRLVKSRNYEGQKEYTSNRALRRDFSGAEIDGDLFGYLCDRQAREELKRLLAAAYLDTPSTGTPPATPALLALLGLLWCVA